MAANSRGRPGGAGRPREANKSADGGFTGESTRPAPACPPGCALVCAVEFAELVHPAPFTAAERVFFALVGVPDPLPGERWGEALRVVAEHHGPWEVVRGLRMAARQPAMAPRDPGGRWWREQDRHRAGQLAEQWQRAAVAEGVVADAA